MQSTQSRRRFLGTLSSAGVAGVIGAPPCVFRGTTAGNEHRSLTEILQYDLRRAPARCR